MGLDVSHHTRIFPRAGDREAGRETGAILQQVTTFAVCSGSYWSSVTELVPSEHPILQNRNCNHPTYEAGFSFCSIGLNFHCPSALATSTTTSGCLGLTISKHSTRPSRPPATLAITVAFTSVFFWIPATSIFTVARCFISSEVNQRGLWFSSTSSLCKSHGGRGSGALGWACAIEKHANSRIATRIAKVRLT